MSAALIASVRAVFFDAVGTLLLPDPPAADVYSAVASRFGLLLESSEVRERFWAAYRIEEARDRSSDWRTSEEREVDRWRRIVGAVLPGVRETEACFHELFEHFGSPSSWRLTPGAADAIQELNARGLTLGIGSNYDSRLMRVLTGFPELEPLISGLVVSAKVGWRKPSVRFFAEVVRAAGCAAGEILFVGDDLENDYFGATRSGLSAVLFDLSATASETVERVRSFRELLE